MTKIYTKTENNYRKAIKAISFLVFSFILCSSVRAQSQKDKEFFNSGLKKAQSGQLDAAITDFTESIKIIESENPEKLTGNGKPDEGTKLLSQNYYYRGVALAATGKKEDAVKDFDKAIKFNLNFVEAYIIRGKTCNDIGDYKRASDNLDVAIKLFPNNFDILFHLGIADQNQGLNKDAVQHFTSALKIKPNDAQSYIERSKCYLLMEKYEEALADVNKAITLDGKNSYAYLCRGIVNRYLENYSFSIRDYTNAITYDPVNATAYYNRGIAYSHSDEHLKAIEDYSKAIELFTDKKDVDEAYLNRGIEKLILNKNQEACSDIKMAADLGNENGVLFFKQEGKEICK